MTMLEIAKRLFAEQNWRGLCYEVAAKLLVAAHGAGIEVKLVQGEPKMRRPGPLLGQRFGHAWVETPQGVWDLTVAPELLSTMAFYAVGSIGEENVRRYDWEEAVVLMLRTEHYGPWEGPEAVGEWKKLTRAQRAKALAGQRKGARNG